MYVYAVPCLTTIGSSVSCSSGPPAARGGSISHALPLTEAHCIIIVTRGHKLSFIGPSTRKTVSRVLLSALSVQARSCLACHLFGTGRCMYGMDVHGNHPCTRMHYAQIAAGVGPRPLENWSTFRSHGPIGRGGWDQGPWQSGNGSARDLRYKESQSDIQSISGRHRHMALPLALAGYCTIIYLLRLMPRHIYALASIHGHGCFSP